MKTLKPYLTLLSLLLITFFLQSCEPMERDWETTLEEKSIIAYKSFIDKYPNSNYDFEAKKAIIELIDSTLVDGNKVLKDMNKVLGPIISVEELNPITINNIAYSLVCQTPRGVRTTNLQLAYNYLQIALKRADGIKVSKISTCTMTISKSGYSEIGGVPMYICDASKGESIELTNRIKHNMKVIEYWER